MKQVRLSVLINRTSARLRKLPKRLEKLLRERDRLTMQLTQLEKLNAERIGRIKNA